MHRMITFANTGVILVSVLLITGCGSADRTEGEGNEPAIDRSYVAASHHDCGTGGRLAVRWAKAMTEISFGGETWLVPRVISGSGARYSDGQREVWEHQGKVRWTDVGTSPRTC